MKLLNKIKNYILNYFIIILIIISVNLLAILKISNINTIKKTINNINYYENIKMNIYNEIDKFIVNDNLNKIIKDNIHVQDINLDVINIINNIYYHDYNIDKTEYFKKIIDNSKIKIEDKEYYLKELNNIYKNNIFLIKEFNVINNYTKYIKYIELFTYVLISMLFLNIIYLKLKNISIKIPILSSSLILFILYSIKYLLNNINYTNEIFSVFFNKIIDNYFNNILLYAILLLIIGITGIIKGEKG